MWLRPKPPKIPTDLVTRYGEPEQTFGPNRRFGVIATVLGFILLVLGGYFYLLKEGYLGREAPGSAFAGMMISRGLLVFAALLLFGAKLTRPTWVFVCPLGLLRSDEWRDWDAVGWSDVAKCEEVHGANFGSNRACRVALRSGETWRIEPDYTGGYPRLMEVLRQKLDANPGKASSVTIISGN